MAEVIWARPAIDDLAEIRRFIARDSEHYADVSVNRIQEAVRRLEQFPLSGRAVPELPGRDLREIILAPYRVIYRYVQGRNTVLVLFVVHGSRSLPDDVG